MGIEFQIYHYFTLIQVNNASNQSSPPLAAKTEEIVRGNAFKVRDHFNIASFEPS